MESLATFKKYLRDFDYPNIASLSDDEVADIFGAENRLHFLTWFIKKLELDFEFDYNTEAGISEIADLLQQSGFCTSSQKMKFVRADMDATEQVRIFSRMLNHLEESRLGEEVLCEEQDVLESLFATDLNLFPNYGPIKQRNLEDRVSKAMEYEEAIEGLKKKIDELEKERDLNTDDTNVIKHDPVDMSNLMEEIHNFKVSADHLLKCKSGKESNVSFGGDFDTYVSQCEERIDKIVKFQNCTETIAKFSVTKLPDEEENETAKSIKMLAEMSNKLVKIKKMADC